MVPVIRRGSPPRQKPQDSRTCFNAEGEAVEIQNLQLSEVWNTPQGRKTNEWFPVKKTTGRDFGERLSRETGAGRGTGDALATQFTHLLSLQEDVPLDQQMTESPVNDDASMKSEVPALVADSSDSSASRKT